MALITPDEVINYGKLQLPTTQTAEQTAARRAEIASLIAAQEAALAEQIGYRFDRIPTSTGTVEVLVRGWDRRAEQLNLSGRVDMLTGVVGPDGATESPDKWVVLGSGWRVRPLHERELQPGLWRFTGELGWPMLPAAARTLLLTWVVDSYDTSGSVTQETNEDGLTSFGFSTSLPLWHQRALLQSLMK